MSETALGAVFCPDWREWPGFERVSSTVSFETLDRHSEGLFEFLWCPVCGKEFFTHIPFEGVFCKNCNTQVEFQESRETRGYEEAVLAYFDTTTTYSSN